MSEFAAAAPGPQAAFAPPIALATFATALRPRRVPLVRNGRPVVVNGAQVMTVTEGHPDEVWLKLLKIRHGSERHTEAEWRAMVDGMRDEPAHPSVGAR